jgi:hypothetical protein
VGPRGQHGEPRGHLHRLEQLDPARRAGPQVRAKRIGARRLELTVDERD